VAASFGILTIDALLCMLYLLKLISVMRIYIYLIFIISILSITQLKGFTDDTMAQNANIFLTQKEYQKALDLYHKIESEQYYSMGLFKNMAIAYAGLNKDALAILYYERALKLSPRDTELKADLGIIIKRNPELDESVPPFFLIVIWQSITSFFSPTIWSILSLLFLGLAGFILFRKLPLSGMDKESYTYFGAAFCLALVFVFAAFSTYHRQYNQDNMIVTESLVVLKTGPDTTSPDVENLPTGAKVSIKDSLGEWLQVNTTNGDIGWIKVDQGVKI